MLRIHFTEQDLARVQVAATPDPMWETVLATQMLGPAGRGLPVFSSWRNRVRAQSSWHGLGGPMRFLRTLVPPSGYFPDFLTPAESGEGLAAGLESLRATPPRRLGREISLMAQAHKLPPWVRDLAAGKLRRLDELREVLQTVHDALLGPHWTEIQSDVHNDRTVRARAACDDGVHGLLRSLRPMLRWEPPVLLARYPVERHIHLDGRGLRLVPSYFCWDTPITLADPELAPVVVYPVAHREDWTRGSRSLTALLGSTRARVLEATHNTLTSGELARRLGISAAAVSRHTTVLRDAGLITSQRYVNEVLHSLTPLGSALLGEHGARSRA